MKHTSKTAAKTLEKLRTAAMPGGYVKINAPGFMPLYAELLETREHRAGVTLELWAVAHTYTQNGDLMRDPEIVFLRAENTGSETRWFPVEFRQDPYIRQELATLRRDLLPESYQPKAQRDCAAFLTTWCRNLEAQGFTSPATAQQQLEMQA